jgi:O-succinylbenzoate synthase
MAAMSNFTLPGDTSASDRYYHRDIITEPFVLHDGRLRVPTGPGLGVTVDAERLQEVTTSTTELRREMQWSSATTPSR